MVTRGRLISLVTMLKKMAQCGCLLWSRHLPVCFCSPKHASHAVMHPSTSYSFTCRIPEFFLLLQSLLSVNAHSPTIAGSPFMHILKVQFSADLPLVSFTKQLGWNMKKNTEPESESLKLPNVNVHSCPLTMLMSVLHWIRGWYITLECIIFVNCHKAKHQTHTHTHTVSLWRGMFYR